MRAPGPAAVVPAGWTTVLRRGSSCALGGAVGSRSGPAAVPSSSADAGSPPRSLRPRARRPRPPRRARSRRVPRSCPRRRSPPCCRRARPPSLLRLPRRRTRRPRRRRASPLLPRLCCFRPTALLRRRARHPRQRRRSRLLGFLRPPAGGPPLPLWTGSRRATRLRYYFRPRARSSRSEASASDPRRRLKTCPPSTPAVNRMCSAMSSTLSQTMRDASKHHTTSQVGSLSKSKAALPTPA